MENKEAVYNVCTKHGCVTGTVWCTYIQAELASVTTQLEELDRKSSGSERTVKDLKEQLEEAQVLTL